MMASTATAGPPKERPNGIAYRAYVLRCLPVRAGPGCPLTWRFSLQAADADAPRHAFSRFEDLAAFLQAELASERPMADRGGAQPDRDASEP